MSFGKKASTGMFWLAAGSVVARLSSFGALLVLGWVLSTQEFALYALAYSSASIFMAIRNGGVQQILIQRGERGYKYISGLYFKFALLFNVLSMVGILLAAPLIVKIYDSEAIYELLVVIAISIPLGTFAMLFRARLAINHQFSDMAKLESISAITRHSSAVLFGLSGFGALSFVLPLIIVAIMDTIIGWLFIKEMPDLTKPVTRGRLVRLFNSAKWMVMASIAIAVILQGDYFVIGLFKDKELVGTYFFGFQITLAYAVIVSSGMQTVMMPLFASMNADKEKQIDAFNKSIKVLFLCVLFASLLLAISAPYLVHYLWSGKWDAAVPVVQLMSISMIAILLTPLGRSILEARGHWRAVSGLLVIDALGTITVTLAASLMGELLFIAVVVSIYRTLFGFAYIMIVTKLIGVNIGEIFRSFFRMIIIGAVAVILIMPFELDMIKFNSELVKLVVMLMVYIVCYWFLIRLICQEQYLQIKRAIPWPVKI